MGPRTHTAKTHLDSANADARPSREATTGAAVTPQRTVPLLKYRARASRRSRAARPVSRGRAWPLTSPPSTALDRGAPLTSPQSTALDLAPRFERRKKKSIPASRFNLPTRHPALGHKISRPLAYVDIFVNNWAAQIRETAPRRASRCVEAQGDASRGCCDRVLESFVVAIVASGGAEIEFSGVWP